MLIDMCASGRRLSVRNPLANPVEAALVLCRGERAHGWIVNEQDDGVGMAFGAGDVARILDHQECCRQASVDLIIGDDEAPDARPVPMRLAHVTQSKTGRCTAGLSFDVRRMSPEDIVHLLGLWRRFVVATRAPR